jgi:hypothetical protein
MGAARWVAAPTAECALAQRETTFMLYERIRSGDWVDASRLRVYPRIYLSVSLAMTIAAVVFSHSALDVHGALIINPPKTKCSTRP